MRELGATITLPPRSVLLMNPVYTGEVRDTLDGLGLTGTELLTV